MEPSGHLSPDTQDSFRNCHAAPKILDVIVRWDTGLAGVQDLSSGEH